MKLLLIILLLVTSSFAQEYSKQEIEKMIAKMVILGFNGTNIEQNSQISKDIKKGLGGVILFDKDPNDKTKAKNIQNKAQLKKLCFDLQSQRKEKLLISIDQEGGVVQRLKTNMGFVDTLKASEISQRGENFAKTSYKNLALDLKSVGINLDFAPVVDLAINKENKVIVTRGRSFGEDPKIVEKYATIFIDEMKKQGILSTLKHFPGHGSSLEDSHLGFVDISKTWSKKELEPYKNLIKNNKAEIIMSAHVFNENLDKDYPATLSYKINTKLLREELGFKGILISDDLQMSAISKHYTLKETLTLAINSGVNLLLFANQLAKPVALDEIINIVYEQIVNKNIPLEKIIYSNKKIAEL